MSLLSEIKKATCLHDFSKILGYSPSGLAYVLYKIPENEKYQKFPIPKRSGGTREISAPRSELKELQKHLANILYACVDEIEKDNDLKSLSHGFRRNHSIITNANQHKCKRFVLNIDLENFFPSFNFGRVRGFFIKNRHFELHENVATILAQIACHSNELPQGSPCSPIIADLITHPLDVRLAQLAKKNGLTYSRYADDLTFSTGKKCFPIDVAFPEITSTPKWLIGKSLSGIIEKEGFSINHKKTRMQFRMSQQLVTGLTVNEKVNIRADYYRTAKSMCHSLFKIGSYYREVECEGSVKQKPYTSLFPLEGILSHINHIKDSVDQRDWKEKADKPTTSRNLYRRFLVYKHFVANPRPIIICEGKTDNIYIKCAMKRLAASFPLLGEFDNRKFKSKVAFFNYSDSPDSKYPSHKIIGLNGGEGDLKFFFIKNEKKPKIQNRPKACFKEVLDSFPHKPLNNPIIVIVDNDQGGKSIFECIKKYYKIQIDFSDNSNFYHITDNLYLVKTPSTNGTESCIEDMFDQTTRDTPLNGKKFNPKSKDQESDSEYGKAYFAKYVVRPNAKSIDFFGFNPLLGRIAAVIEDYKEKNQKCSGSP